MSVSAVLAASMFGNSRRRRERQRAERKRLEESVPDTLNINGDKYRKVKEESDPDNGYVPYPSETRCSIPDSFFEWLNKIPTDFETYRYIEDSPRLFIDPMETNPGMCLERDIGNADMVAISLWKNSYMKNVRHMAMMRGVQFEGFPKNMFSGLNIIDGVGFEIFEIQYGYARVVRATSLFRYNSHYGGASYDRCNAV